MNTNEIDLSVPGEKDCLWQYTIRSTGFTVRVRPPAFEIDGHPVVACLRDIHPAGVPRSLANGATESVFAGHFADDPTLKLDLVFRVASGNPVVRFIYRLSSSRGAVLTKAGGRDQLVYGGVSLAGLSTRKEVRFSEFDESIHSFRLVEEPIRESAFDDELAAMGPMLVAGDRRHTILVAYEHGSQAPDTFLEYRFTQAREATLHAMKGNYMAGRMLTAENPYETLWFHVAAVAGDESVLAAGYREFILRYQTQNLASRKPYIFYNTWAFQERNKWWNGAKYLDSMKQDRMLAEIDVAHKMGIDVFVLDTGWYDRTGDWRVNHRFFPDDLKAVRERLERYGMKLGLWFSPTLAAVSSRMVKELPECRMAWDGKLAGPGEVWETEASYGMCLVTRYWEAFADELIRLVKDLGVTYFKWDAVGQYGCNSPDHAHGGPENTAAERAECYAFELVRYMNRVVDKVGAACPEAIVDFDITEGGRTVGLGFLATGKYFLINNGPYFSSFDIPYDWATAKNWSNVFVYPGPARPRICRAPLDFDKWLPSILFLTHYLPDDPEGSQVINLASLVLGQNGIWGDLLALSEEGVARFGQMLGLYKQVRDDITGSVPVRAGIVGGSPEIHEKISEATGRGVVAVFAGAAGRYTYVTAHRVADSHWVTPGTTVRRDAAGRAVLECVFEKAGAHLCFFGVKA